METQGPLMVALGCPNPFATLFQEIADIAQQSLRRSSYVELRDIACDFSGGVLTLHGRVPTYHLKQLAQASVTDIPGVVEINNQLEVASSHLFQNHGPTMQKQPASRRPR